jgi:hypothetical protein
VSVRLLCCWQCPNSNGRKRSMLSSMQKASRYDWYMSRYVKRSEIDEKIENVDLYLI